MENRERIYMCKVFHYILIHMQRKKSLSVKKYYYLKRKQNESFVASKLKKC